MKVTKTKEVNVCHKNLIQNEENMSKMLSNAYFVCENSGKMDTPTKMALVQHLNGLKMQNGWYHRVLHEKLYRLCRFDGSS
jgi:preprotein translocase subunit SecA